MPSKRHLALAAACTLAVVAAWTTVVPRSAGAEPTVTVSTELPAWVAPGARLQVRGRTSPNTRVRLWIGNRVRARTVSFPGGGFRLRVRAPMRVGRYPVAVAAAETRVELGTLRVRPLRLAAVGDVTFGDGVLTAIRAHGARYPWRSVAPVLRSADLTVANLEGAVSTRGSPWPGKQYTFRGPPYALRASASFAGVDVGAARRRADVVVAYFHWGVERATTPNARQRSLAQVALDAGAHVVLGAHPHVLQPIERTRRRLVAWSLGNFVFAAHSPGTERTGILRVRLGARGVIGRGFRRARIHGVRPQLVG